MDKDNDAHPEWYRYGLESHGTACAGEIAMEKGNAKCGVGVAYNATITGKMNGMVYTALLFDKTTTQAYGLFLA